MRPPPGPIRSVVLAAESLFDDLIVLAGGNLAFGLSLLVVAIAAQLSLLGNLLVIPLALPAAGVMRAATVSVRRGTPRLNDLAEPYRRPMRVLGPAAIQLVATALLALDIALGAAAASLVGSILAVVAVYGLLLVWLVAITAWPLLLDPDRDAVPARACVRLAFALILARPVRSALLGVITGVFMVLAAVSVLAILSFGLAFVWLILAHTVLPEADRLEGRTPDAEEASASARAAEHGVGQP